MPRLPKAAGAAATLAMVQHFIHSILRSLGEGGHLASHGMVGFVLANGPAGAGSSNQSGDCPARSASSKPKAKPQSLPRQRDIRKALIDADLVDTAACDSAFPQSEATPQVLLRSREANKAKNNMVALPGQLFYSSQIPEMFQKAA